MPTTTGIATDFITFSRASTATRVNASGLIESVASGVARRDFDPVTLACKGLLVEEARTNFFLRSDNFTVSPWYVAAGTLTITAGAATDPSGANTATSLVTGAGSNGVLAQNSTPTSGTAYTISFWMRTASGTATVGVVTSGAAAGNASVTSSWQRFAFTVTAPTSSTVQNTINVPANTTVYIWGAQLEAGSFATSYIPTGASTATRTADVASVSTQAFPYSATEGSYVANFQTLFSGANSLTTTILTVDGSSSKLIAYITGGAQNPGTFDGSTIISVANDVTGSVAKIGSSFDASGRSFCANGSTVATGTVAAGYGSGSAVNIGGTLGTGYINGWFRQLTYIPRRLSNAELQARTAA